MGDTTAADLVLAEVEHASLFEDLHEQPEGPVTLKKYCKDLLNAVGVRSGLTPLAFSVLKGNAATVQMLLAAGADPAAEVRVYDTLSTVEDEDDDDDNKCFEFPLSISTREGSYLFLHRMCSSTLMEVLASCPHLPSAQCYT